MKTISDDTVEIPREKPVFVDPSGRRRRIVRRVSIAACALVSGYAVLLVASLLGAPIPASVLLPVPAAPSASPAPPPQGGPSVADDTTAPRGTDPSSQAQTQTEGTDQGTTAPVPQAPAVTTTAAPQPPSSPGEPRNSRARPDPPGRGQGGEPEPGR